ncbi:hypothetical protein ESY86_19920 [Subsaximicrobium wynnwilliamsii]|jgi:hypothetical protein|uniref:DUF3887 domain-containing protein n=1 Tax=Subsaximicrobium wynnwilliamsii TaxID=291179 RepID=A0A5C6ZAN6_9FLAO|nr:hypothetical protein [Subsaximicrobium wynnwilliamsii]TXD80806.1 hypothetical protein ESY87_20090 [Subsaximicrobium wynnwilliamsii]TXD86548.1 hypothetical protein ESY86_19920 [Subsaximicrobium wynnwilliamsii]TXE00094.1 hypothetical protein ESY88_20030 [Subsaximicrobium wynnwilliamsii]
MKKIALTFIFLISINVFSQEEKRIFNSEFEKFVLQCETIGRTITNKDIETEFSNWYEGIDSEKLNLEVKQLESDIKNSELEVTYSLIMMSENPLIYSFHFYNEITKTEYGQLFIRFADRENNLVDDIKVVSKTQLEEINKESEIELENMNIPPPPPPPPIKKKKNEN